MNEIVRGLAQAQVKDIVAFNVGDTIKVTIDIVEGVKSRPQAFEGVVMKITGSKDNGRFTVRKMSGEIAVERIFPFNMPALTSVELKKHGKVRRAKLHYLRGLTGKKARIKSRDVKKSDRTK